MAFVFGKTTTRPGPSNRVTVFVLSSTKSVRKVVGTQNRFLAGLYIPRAGASVALVPKLGRTSGSISGETVLYHEYAHHFMRATLTDRAYPRWFVEGFAEFFGSKRFREDGSVVLGAPAEHRGADRHGLARTGRREVRGSDWRRDQRQRRQHQGIGRRERAIDLGAKAAPELPRLDVRHGRNRRGTRERRDVVTSAGKRRRHGRTSVAVRGRAAPNERATTR